MAKQPAGAQPPGGAHENLARGFEALGRVIDQVSDRVSALRGELERFTAPLQALSRAVQGVVDLGREMQQFVALASPAALQQFTLALSDLQAVVGRALLPVFNEVTRVVRAVGDAAAGLAPRVQALLQSLVEAARPLVEVALRVGAVIADVVVTALGALAVPLAAAAEVVALLAEAVAPLVEVMAQVVKAVALVASTVLEYLLPPFVALVRVMRDVVEWVAKVVGEFLAFFGLAPERRRDGSSVGAAARSASVGSVESVVSRAQQSAFAIGTAGTTADKTLSAVTGLLDKADQIYKEIVALPEKVGAFFRELPEKIAAAVRGFGSAAVERAERSDVGRFVSGVGDALAEARDSARDFVNRGLSAVGSIFD